MVIGRMTRSAPCVCPIPTAARTWSARLADHTARQQRRVPNRGRVRAGSPRVITCSNAWCRSAWFRVESPFCRMAGWAAARNPWHCWFDRSQPEWFSPPFILRFLLFHLPPTCDTLLSSHMNCMKPKIAIPPRGLPPWVLKQETRPRHAWNLPPLFLNLLWHLAIGLPSSRPVIESGGWFGDT
jgi:hypothetical protein